MKFTRLLFLFVCAASSAMYAQTPTRLSKEVPKPLQKVLSPKTGQAHPLLLQVPRLLAAPAVTSLAGITSVVCPELAASLCGYVPVPLDRNHPKGTQLQIYFEVYPHTNPGPAVSAILVNLGGPGISTTPGRDYFQFLFAPNLDVHDLVLVDDRGTGQSGALDCEPFQHDTGTSFMQEEAACAAQLGVAASRYANGDIAQDMEAVRQALGYNLIDYLGASFGGADATAYAVRYPQHTRSLVLDAPLSTPGLPALARIHQRVNSDPRMVRLVCQRSVLCSQDHPEPDETFLELIERIREHPIAGDSFDVNGNPLHVKIDEDALLNFVVTYPAGEFVNTGEILAAADSLEDGDKVPLLRLGAEGFFTLTGDSGDPTGLSAAAYTATNCGATIEPFSWSVPPFARIDQYNDAVAAQPPFYDFPFSPFVANDILFSTAGRQCFWWQLPTPPSPVVPAHTKYPNTPTLVLDGDIDNRVPLEETNQVAALFPNSTKVTIPEAGHETTGWSACADAIANNFIETLSAGDTSCAATPGALFAAVGRFPLFAEDARPAKIDPSGNNQIDLAERKVVSVAVATTVDAQQRSWVGSGTGVGLRGGTFTSTFFTATYLNQVTLINCMFSKDIVVNGVFTWGYDSSVVADITVSGPGTAGGSLHFTGFHDGPGPVGNYSVTGTLGGKQVAALVPEG
ncbi:MAG TPA: alpha/beta fold hydrolase [Candidatus Acidoferrum sp.]